MIFAVARNRFLNLKHDRAAFVLAFVVPIVFFSVFALIFGGTRSATRRVGLILVDEDSSENSRRFAAALAAEKGLAVETARTVASSPDSVLYDRDSAVAAVRGGRVSVALLIPKGFGESPLTFANSGDKKPRLILYADTADPVAPQLVTGVIQRVVVTAIPDALARAGIQAIDRWGGGLTAEQREKLEASSATLRTPGPTAAPGPGTSSAQAPGVLDIEVEDVLGQAKQNPTSTLLAAGLGVMFLLFSAAGAGGALIEEAESGTLDRILATRVSMTPLLLGKLLYLCSVAFIQLTVMFVWGEIFFGVELHRHIGGFVIISIATALATSTFGLVLAALSRSRMQLVALSNLIILVMSAVGGSMVPRYFLSESIQKLGLWTINAWAIDGFLKVFWREEPVSHLWPQVLVLLLAAAVLFLLARRLARRWEFEN
jgi:ABC-2 type transport system permease protein